MKRIYVAGAITPTSPDKNHAIEFLENVRKGIMVANELIILGYAPYCPMMDFQYWLSIDSPPTADEIYKVSMAHMEGCVAVFLISSPNLVYSKGWAAEKKRANELGIPVFDNFEDLLIEEEP